MKTIPALLATLGSLALQLSTLGCGVPSETDQRSSASTAAVPANRWTPDGAGNFDLEANMATCAAASVQANVHNDSCYGLQNGQVLANKAQDEQFDAQDIPYSDFDPLPPPDSSDNPVVRVANHTTDVMYLFPATADDWESAQENGTLYTIPAYDLTGPAQDASTSCTGQACGTDGGRSSVITASDKTIPSGFEKLPQCARSCYINAIPKIGCLTTDLNCICDKSSQLSNIVSPCILTNCSADKVSEVQRVIQQICVERGKKINRLYKILIKV